LFRKILVANRGEIAQRILHACRELGVRSVTVHSEVDRGSSWVRLADESYPLPGNTAQESYLNQEAILEIARARGVEAVHPGYGFLSENADFAAACAASGLAFIGPTPAAMRALGNKAAARKLAEKMHVPVIPGVDAAGFSPQELREKADEIGYPLLVKAAAGGGGMGMRVINSPTELADGLRDAQSEAASSFGSGQVLLEKFFPEVRHIEVQVLGDQHGNLLHLFERECSIQRRRQKIIEESPSPFVTSALREQICAAALALARAVGYVSAGTVEFVVTPAEQFYFLEMNTRLQVEHPITELVTGVDLVTWQIRIAAGEPLSFKQEHLAQRGHAIECRLYSEDPAQNFLPSIGEIALFRPPAGPGIRDRRIG